MVDTVGRTITPNPLFHHLLRSNFSALLQRQTPLYSEHLLPFRLERSRENFLLVRHQRRLLSRRFRVLPCHRYEGEAKEAKSVERLEGITTMLPSSFLAWPPHLSSCLLLSLQKGRFHQKGPLLNEALHQSVPNFLPSASIPFLSAAVRFRHHRIGHLLGRRLQSVRFTLERQLIQQHMLLLPLTAR